MSFREFLGHLKEPIVIEAIVGVALFVVILLVFRRMRLVAAELERRKALGDYVRGLDEFLRGDYREGITTLERVLERDPESVEARIALGDCYREIGDPAEGKKHHHHVHKVFGNELARNFLSLGHDELALKNYDRAVEAFQRAHELTPADTDALAGLAAAYAEGGNPIEAATYLRRIYPNGPAKDMNRKERRLASRRFAEAGNALLEDGDAAGAVRLLTEALVFQPENIRARTAIVRAAHELGDNEEARRLVEEHMAELRRLSADDDVLFEPSAPRPADPEATFDAQPKLNAGESEPPSYLPARVEEVGGVVAAVEQKTARYICGACGALLRDYARQCPVCETVGTVDALDELEALYLTPITDFREKLDEVEENASFVQTLAHRAAHGDDEAMQRLLEKGAAVFYDIFQALPAIEGRRALGARLGALGSETAVEVRQCHAGSGGGGLGAGARPHDDFAAAFYLALPDPDAYLGSLGEAHDAAVAGVLADPRVADDVRDAAEARLAARGAAVLPVLIEAVALTEDAGGVERAARLVAAWGRESLDDIERRYLQATLLRRLFKGGKKGARRRVAADVLARTGQPIAAEILARAAAGAKDASLRAHYLAAKDRAEQGGPA